MKFLACSSILAIPQHTRTQPTTSTSKTPPHVLSWRSSLCGISQLFQVFLDLHDHSQDRGQATLPGGWGSPLKKRDLAAWDYHPEWG